MRHAATINKGSIGVLHGAKSLMLQNEDGQTLSSHSISAGLDYPGVGPQHAWLNQIERAEYYPITDSEAMDALRTLSETEGIIPAIETAHALAGAMTLGKQLGPSGVILISLSGRGDKDMATVKEYFSLGDS
jgi:tryptophan synthase beta chain